jgi:catechol 2,3-dioxygenase-like lactoylglutathione lyase family enzyme
VPVAIDHVVVAVSDLNATIEDYKRLGFTVIIGGEHAHRGSHNALIAFQDGSYIELIAFRHEPPVKDNTWWDLLQIGEGLVDTALLVDDLPQTLAGLAGAGFSITGPMQGGRHLPEGQRIDWRVARLDVDGPVRYPFLIDDLTPHELRVPQGEAAVHPNGATGIARIVLGVPSVAAAREWFGLIYGPGQGDTFAVGSQQITLVDPDSATPDQAARLASHGAGPVEIVMTGITSPGGTLPLDMTHGARFVTDPA